MKIVDVICRLVSYEVPRERQYRTDFGWAVKFDNNYVEVHTDEGIIGYGASFGSAPIVKAIVHKQLKPMLLGEDPMMVERLWHKMYCGSRCDISLEKGYAMPVYQRRGESVAALSAVDMALWDIVGKAAGLPLYKVFGGCRDRVRAYGSGGWQVAELIAEEVREYVSKGFSAIKMRAEGREGAFTVKKSMERVRAVRKEIGADCELFVDAHCCLDVNTAIKYAKALEECDVGWLEEPISPDDHEGLKLLRSQAHTCLSRPTPEIGDSLRELQE